MSIIVKIASSNNDIKKCLELRKIVFTYEQGVDNNIDWDDQDGSAIHFMAEKDDKLMGTLRFRSLEGGATIKIERMAVLKEFRNQGIGRLLMEQSTQYIKENGMAENVILNAQISAIPFYTSVGFDACGQEFSEAGIPHQKMQLNLN